MTSSLSFRRVVAPGVAALAVASLALGAWQALAPRSFYDALGPFGPFNDHALRDYATWSLAYGGALLVALRRPSWRVPLLALGLGQFALHALNHVADAGEAGPGWIGVADAVSLGVAALLLVVLLVGAEDAEAAR
ncbi:MAG TPA: hypothetical protein VLB47_06670 [Solirubrobacteraceae bacterium]|nr:hypothetical protein [Solirubrobacteraceae bacterium]